MPLSTIGSNQITDGAIAVADVADGSISTAKLADNAVTTAKITDDAVTSAKVDTNIAVAGTLGVTGQTTLSDKLTINFNGSGSQAFKFKDTGGGNLASFGQFYNPSDSLMANIQNANNDGIHVMVGNNGSLVFDQTGYNATNALDDYEKGTWTPAWGTGSGQSYTQQMGTYVKIGRQVTVTCFVMTSDMNSQTGDASVANLPFTASQGTFSTFPRAWGVVNGDNNWDTNLSTNNLVAQISGGATTIRPRFNSGHNTSDIQLQHIGGGNSYFGCTVTYETDS